MEKDFDTYINELLQQEEGEFDFEDRTIELFEVLKKCKYVYTVNPTNLKYGNKILQDTVYRGSSGLVDFELDNGIKKRGTDKSTVPLIGIYEYWLVPNDIIEYYTPTPKKSFLEEPSPPRKLGAKAQEIRELVTIKTMPYEDFESCASVVDAYGLNDFIPKPIYLYSVPTEYLKYCGGAFRTHPINTSLRGLKMSLDIKAYALKTEGIVPEDIPLLQYVLYPSGEVEWFDVNKGRAARHKARYRKKSDVARQYIQIQTIKKKGEPNNEK